ncbi:rod shape-determining protein MreC [Gallibacterium anatis]|uniref:Cell shape-determining protein MreC n=4 Tax=Gallibacterium TaxID=155493 RepID=A0A0A2XL43_9PAST|nr:MULTISPECIES: rod shape-determining protein MreC [Gallibacterium]AEC16438.1 rod shape-determining protein MreC [Gallibacterium anatis UMN179]ERF79521.1 rod shape-determining protein MreC [Gallibacterium anatis 12656/12]KGQ24732.1 rod shape-determining protein MreC [Gallibacterium anatis]KGQ26741.1 rod shape-determining protein MreC [Gallibacterium anatis]KGQ27989.1 rod shape-determining protein MreC [Gallibacterium anatis CCM5995]
MKPIFSKSPSLGVRLVFATLLSVILMFSDGQTRNLLQLRSLLETAVSWIYYLANTPRSLLDGVSDNLVDTNTLQIENKVLKDQLLEKNADLLLLDQLKVENQRLRLLLNSPLRHDEYKKIAEVLTAETDPYRQQVVINRGEKDGAYVGQPVIDEKGVVGQIISVGQNTSRILLISDVTHSIPLQVLRSDIRVIASGTGRADELVLDNVSRSADIEKGDLLVTSGLGHRFPEGYPVAIVESVSREGNNYFATVVAKPLASLERLRYLLLLWPTNEDIKRLHNSPNQIKEVVKQRLSSSQQNNDENKSGNEENDPPLEQRQPTPAKEKIEEE